MEKNNPSVVEKFLSDTDTEQVNPFEGVIEDPFNKTEPKEEVVEEKEERIPFNKDPKIQRYIDKLVEKRIKEVTPEPRESAEADYIKDVMDSMVEAVGNDTPQKIKALQAYESALRKLDHKAESKAEEYLTQIQNEEYEAEKEAEDELDNAFNEIEETFGVDISSPRSQKIRAEFLDYVERIAPKRNGEIIDYPDMTSAWETFSEIKKATATPSRAKELANRGMSRSSEATSVPQKRITWDSADEHIESLK